jgi:hypothetical protein
VIPVARLALVRLKMWESGRTLRCRFLHGDATQKENVQAKAQIWEQYANVDFQFVDSDDAEIRISVSADPGSGRPLERMRWLRRIFQSTNRP